MQIQKVNNRNSFGNISKVRINKKIAGLKDKTVDVINKAILMPEFYSLGGDKAYYELKIIPEVDYIPTEEGADKCLSGKICISANKIKTELKKTLFGGVKTKDKVIPAKYYKIGYVKNENDVISLTQKAIDLTDNQIAREEAFAEAKQLTK